MIITFVDNLPTGDEEGVLYALDLGGTNFRVLRVRLGGKTGGIVDKEFTKLSIPPHLMVGTSEVGKDVVAELTSALKRQGVDVSVSAWYTLFFATHDTRNMFVLILGTGTNAAYVERIQEIPKWHGPPLKSGEMVINMEWGDFRSAHMPLTEYDNALDAESLNPGEQMFEKLVSGMYLGDIVRRVLCRRMAEEAALFGEKVPQKMKTPFILRTFEMIAMHLDTSPDLKVVGKYLMDIFEISNTTLQTRKIVVELCKIVATRGARLSAAGILGILKKMGRDTVREGEMQKTVIAMDGGVYEQYTFYRECLLNTLRELVGEEVSKSVVAKLFNDGSGIGAALLAASHSRHLEPMNPAE